MVSNNIFQVIAALRNSSNPQNFILNILQKNAEGNPMAANLLELAQHQDRQGIQQVAENLLKERGLDFNSEFVKFRNTFNL